MTKPFNPTELKRLHRTWRRKGELELALLLDGVQNPFNLGSILRSAAAYRVDVVWMAPPMVELPHAKVAKTALGCERMVDIEAVDSGLDGLRRASAAGYTTIAIELAPGGRPLYEIPVEGPVCLVMGHEERGVKGDTLAAVDHVGYLPLVGKVGSLNVAHATTVALYELSRRRWAAGAGPDQAD